MLDCRSLDHPKSAHAKAQRREGFLLPLTLSCLASLRLCVNHLFRVKMLGTRGQSL
jgi:hypothetical protein